MLVRVQTAADGPQSPGRVPGTVRAVSVRMRAMSGCPETLGGEHRYGIAWNAHCRLCIDCGEPETPNGKATP